MTFVSLSKQSKNFVSWGFATDESTDQKDMAQLAIFVKGVDGELNETEELWLVQSIKNTITGADIFMEVFNAFKPFKIDLITLCGIATDGGQAMSRPGIVLVGLLNSALQ